MDTVDQKLPSEYFELLRAAGHFPRDIEKLWHQYMSRYPELPLKRCAKRFTRTILASADNQLNQISIDWHPRAETIERLRVVGIPERELTGSSINNHLALWRAANHDLGTVPFNLDTHFFNHVVFNTNVFLEEYLVTIERGVQAFFKKPGLTNSDWQKHYRWIYGTLVQRSLGNLDRHRIFTLVQWFEYCIGYTAAVDQHHVTDHFLYVPYPRVREFAKIQNKHEFQTKLLRTLVLSWRRGDNRCAAAVDGIHDALTMLNGGYDDESVEDVWNLLFEEARG